MYIKLLIIILFAIIFSGCATTSKVSGQSGVSSVSSQESLNNLEDESFDPSDELPLVKDVKYTPTVSLSPKQIQKALKNAGFYNGSIDGKIGPKTKDSIKRFQKAHRLKADGVVGKSTLAKLSKYLK